jgi:predicted nucleotidyltransferase component of viral defense system
MTSFKTPTDFRKSLEARLKGVANKQNQDLQRLRRKVAFERLLARIFHDDSNSFILKGGYAMELRFSTARATKDIDLTCLRRIDAPDAAIEHVIVRELQKLVKVDLQDYFIFEVGPAQKDLDNAPYGGARYSVSSFVDRRLFVRFQLDVGADVVVDEIEHIDGSDWLKFCGIDTPKMRMISVEQQFAEKLHAYTLPREQAQNSRAKDLVDMLLLLQLRPIRRTRFKEILQKVYSARGTHTLPSRLAPPPSAWLPLYENFVVECNLSQSMQEAYAKLQEFFQIHVLET